MNGNLVLGRKKYFSPMSKNFKQFPVNQDIHQL